MNFHDLGAEGRLPQCFAGFSRVGKLGMNWRWESRGWRLGVKRHQRGAGASRAREPRVRAAVEAKQGRPATPTTPWNYDESALPQCAADEPTGGNEGPPPGPLRTGG